MHVLARRWSHLLIVRPDQSIYHYRHRIIPCFRHLQCIGRQIIRLTSSGWKFSWNLNDTLYSLFAKDVQRSDARTIHRLGHWIVCTLFAKLKLFVRSSPWNCRGIGSTVVSAADCPNAWPGLVSLLFSTGYVGGSLVWWAGCLEAAASSLLGRGDWNCSCLASPLTSREDAAA